MLNVECSWGSWEVTRTRSQECLRHAPQPGASAKSMASQSFSIHTMQGIGLALRCERHPSQNPVQPPAAGILTGWA
jgi:hypothetical protein